MSKRTESSAIIDGLLNLVVTGGVLGVGLVAPNALQALDKPLQVYFKKMDKRSSEREIQRLMYYMKRQGLISSEDYEHGIKITRKGQKRAKEASFDNLAIATPSKWDKKWRIVFYDIPEKHKLARDHLTSKLRKTGFYQLQRSIWLHPFPCRQEIEVITLRYGVGKYISYIETEFIDNQQKLIKYFDL